RYGDLMQELGGQELSGIGFALGVDRVLLAAEAEGVTSTLDFVSDLFIIPLGDRAMVKSLEIATLLRAAGKIVEIAFGDRALKGAMKAADKCGARYVVVLGDKELSSKSVEVKNMHSGISTSVTISSLINAL
ncbi:MAG: His/Gly/Thr/Pro-type tRNA ligase C-terminal domain-containing protein, partial [Actinomycetota bacterium]|nr:His/Gly/Thr/Pro-type tRNA ligase C-terminal domain-containing protein [Actinomycetota bacterium]